MSQLTLYAKHYRRLGLNVTCLSDVMTEYNFYCRNRMKSPNHAWLNLLTSRQSEDEFLSLDWSSATGVGCVGGYNNLRVLDIDGCASIQVVEDILRILDLPRNYEWAVQSGSKNGFHIYFYSQKLDAIPSDIVVSAFPPKKTFEHLFEKIEVLWSTNVALPPSMHPSGHLYSFLFTECPNALPYKIEQSKLLAVFEKYLEVNLVYNGVRYGDMVVDIKFADLPTDLDNVRLPDHYNNLIMVLDIETDGLIKGDNALPKYPAILQVAWLIMDAEGTIFKKESSLIRDHGGSTVSATHINSITESALTRVGKPKVEVYKKLVSDLKCVSSVVCHNVDFDLPIITYHVEKIGFHDIFEGLNKICTMKSTVNFCAIQDGIYLKYPKLSELYNKLFGAKLQQLHNAEADILATAICLKKLIEMKIIEIN